MPKHIFARLLVLLYLVVYFTKPLGGCTDTDAESTYRSAGFTETDIVLPTRPLQVITMSGSVRIKTCDLELSQQTIPVHEIAGGQGAGGASTTGQATVSSGGQQAASSSGAGEDGQRAVDNQYSYV